MKLISSVLALLLAFTATQAGGPNKDPSRWCKLNLGPAWGGRAC